MLSISRVTIGSSAVEPVLVDADDDVLAAVDARLLLRCASLDPELRPAAFDRLGHAPHRLDLLDDRPRRVGHVLGQLFHEVGAGPRVDHAADVGFFLNHQLRVAGDAGGEVRRQRDRLVERVRMQRLRAAEHRGHGLDRRAHDVVVGILLGERPARRLAVRAQHHRLLMLRRELLHDPPPQQARRAQLGDLQIEIHADGEEERQPAGELVDIQAGRQRRAHVFLAVGERQREFQRLRRTRLLHVVAGNRDRVELRHVLRRVPDDVADDPHRWRRRIDVRVADHELLEDVVLDRAGELLLPHALLLGGDDVAGEHRQHRAVHRHRHRHPVERDAVEQDLHVLDRIDRHPRFADVADHARMVGIVATMGGEIEGHRHALTAAVEIAPVERVRFLGGGETGVLADRPRPLCVHRRLRAANERLEPGQRVGMGEALDVGRRVQRLDRNAFRRVPYQAVDRLAA